MYLHKSELSVKSMYKDAIKDSRLHSNSLEKCLSGDSFLELMRPFVANTSVISFQPLTTVVLSSLILTKGNKESC